MPSLEPDEPTSDDVSAAQEVFNTWQDGAQEQAIARLKPLADDGRPWALSLITWLYMQRGVPDMAVGVPYAKRAAELGMHWAPMNLFSNMVANAASFPEGIDSALELVAQSGPWWSGIDPVAPGWSLIGQGRVAEGVRLIGFRTPFPVTSQEWLSLSETAHAQVERISAALGDAAAEATLVGTEAATHKEAMEKVRNDLETSAKQAELLVTKVTSEATEARFDADATRNENESRSAWKWGLWILAAAATVAVAPLALHYVGIGPDYSTGALLGAHAGSTAALATVAGVLLARARSRDLARQRANDLSTAIATMITYSSQIGNEGERQTFMTTMGQLILQSHLTTGPQGHQTEESLPGLIALINLLKPSNPGSSS